MTDVIRPANGQTAGARSARNAWQDPHSTAGYDAAIGERNLTAEKSGEASARPNRLGAASPAGWLLLADGEAAPPFRQGMEPVRSDGASALEGADGNDDDGRPAGPPPSSLHSVSPLWPWSFQNGSRHIPVVGPTEALRGRAGGPGMAVPSGAVPGLLDPQQRSGWQLAQEVWQDSGVVWELIEAESSGPALRSADFAEAAPAAPRPAEMGSRRAWLDEAGPADPGLAAELANAQLAAAGLANQKEIKI